MALNLPSTSTLVRWMSSSTVILFAVLSIASGFDCGPGGVIEIAGSSTVYPVALEWKESFEEQCPQYTVNVRGGGSSAGARQVCNQFLATNETAVDIGDMSRQWRDFRNGGEASTNNGWYYECIDSDRRIIQLLIGYDGLSVSVARNSEAERCVNSLPGGGLTVDQLRWMFSSYSEDELNSTGWDPSSVAASDGDDARRTWFELGGTPDCADRDILISGADIDSGTQQYFREVVFESDFEFFGKERPGGYFNSKLDEDVAAYLENQTDAIGYFGYFYVKENEHLIAAVKIKNPDIGIFVEPSPEHISEKIYAPFSRPLYMNLLDEPLSLNRTRPFIAHALSTKGDTGIREVGYVQTSLAERALMLTRAGAEGGVATGNIKCGNEKGTVSIAGTYSEVAIAKLWSNVYNLVCDDLTITVDGGDSSDGARQVCNQHLQANETAVDIGLLSSPWSDFLPEVSTSDGWLYRCTSSSRTVVQIDVGYESLVLATARSGPAYECIQVLGGLSAHQVRWIFSSFDENELIETGWDPDSLPFPDDNSTTHKWSELSSNCQPVEIGLVGPHSNSASYAYMASVLFPGQNESFAISRSFEKVISEEDLDSALQSQTNAIGFFGGTDVIHTSTMVPILNPSTDLYVSPNPFLIMKGDYIPFSRRISMNLNRDTDSYPLARSFISFGLSNTGRQLLELIGFSKLSSWENLVMNTRAETSSGVSLSDIVAQGCSPKNSSVSFAGSSAVSRLAQAWSSIYMIGCPSQFIIEEGASDDTASRVCDLPGNNGKVDVGGMTRNWLHTEALASADGSTFQCIQSDKKREIVRIPVATEAIAIVSSRGGVADQCIQSLGGLSLHQLRWIYSSLNETELASDPSWNSTSVPHRDDDDSTHLWSELKATCQNAEIEIVGPKTDSGLRNVFRDLIFSYSNETVATDRPIATFESLYAEALVAHLKERPAALAFLAFSDVGGWEDVVSLASLRNEMGELVKPSYVSISLGQYNPLSFPVYMYLWKDATSLSKTLPWIKFGFSTVGEDLVGRIGLIPVNDSVKSTVLEELDAMVKNLTLSSGNNNVANTNNNSSNTTDSAPNRTLLWVGVGLGGFVVLCICPLALSVAAKSSRERQRKSDNTISLNQEAAALSQLPPLGGVEQRPAGEEDYNMDVPTATVTPISPLRGPGQSVAGLTTSSNRNDAAVVVAPTLSPIMASYFSSSGRDLQLVTTTTTRTTTVSPRTTNPGHQPSWAGDQRDMADAALGLAFPALHQSSRHSRSPT